MVFLLELTIATPSQVIVEPLGIYSSIDKAEEYAKLVRKRFPTVKGSQVSIDVIPYHLDQKPPILDIKVEPTPAIRENLVYLYENGVLDQVVEEDGTFSYILTPKFKQVLEKSIAK